MPADARRTQIQALDLDLLTARLVRDVRGDRKTAIDMAELREVAGLAFMMGANVYHNVAAGRRTCRICGCWELEACDPPCSWLEGDLCSACGKGFSFGIVRRG